MLAAGQCPQATLTPVDAARVGVDTEQCQPFFTRERAYLRGRYVVREVHFERTETGLCRRFDACEQG